MTWSGSPEGLADAVRTFIGSGRPLDPDEVCAAVGAGIDVDDQLPHLPASREGNTVLVRPGLSRPIERWWVFHESGHIAMQSPDFEDLAQLGRLAVLEDDELAARYAVALAVPAWELVERLEYGELIEDLAIEYGLTVRHLTMVAERVYERWQNPLGF